MPWCGNRRSRPTKISEVFPPCFNSTVNGLLGKIVSVLEPDIAAQTVLLGANMYFLHFPVASRLFFGVLSCLILLQLFFLLILRFTYSLTPLNNILCCYVGTRVTYFKDNTLNSRIASTQSLNDL